MCNFATHHVLNEGKWHFLFTVLCSWRISWIQLIPVVYYYKMLSIQSKYGKFFIFANQVVWWKIIYIWIYKWHYSENFNIQRKCIYYRAFTYILKYIKVKKWCPFIVQLYSFVRLYRIHRFLFLHNNWLSSRRYFVIHVLHYTSIYPYNRIVIMNTVIVL